MYQKNERENKKKNKKKIKPEIIKDFACFLRHIWQSPHESKNALQERKINIQLEQHHSKAQAFKRTISSISIPGRRHHHTII